jgi:hypothetical protein
VTIKKTHNKTTCSRWFRFDCECPSGNCYQGRCVVSRFLKLVGSLPPEEQQLWIPNQTTHDPDSWHVPHFLNLKTGYDILLNNHNCNVQEMYTVQDHPPSPNEFLLLPPLESLSTRLMCEIRSDLNRGILNHRLKTQFLSRWWMSGNRGGKACKSREIHTCCNNWHYTHNK